MTNDSFSTLSAVQRHALERGWQPVIGLETHVQLRTHSKIFSPASTRFGADPNSQVHWIDAALPGTLPSVNHQAIQYAIRFGLAIEAHICLSSIFARKHYFYPDLPKGYQISQFEEPIVEHGHLCITIHQQEKKVTILRAHLEEDAGKLVHDLYPHESAIDLNRAGTPLIEVVTTPCLNSAAEAVAYAYALHELVQWIGICDGNMQEGSFRMDANISLRPINDQTLGTRCEIKNLNSFRFLDQAIEFEIERQMDILESGGIIHQETRLFNTDVQQTQAMRSKEEAHDYRYFPDPDLLSVMITPEQIDAIRITLPELPQTIKHRLIHEYLLSVEEAEALTSSFAKAHYFIALLTNMQTQAQSENDQCALPKMAKLAANWTLGGISALLNSKSLSFDDSEQLPCTQSTLATLLLRQCQGVINNSGVKIIFSDLSAQPIQATQATIDDLIDQKQLRIMDGENGDQQALLDMIETAIAENPKALEEYRNGKTKAIMRIMGAVMKASAGRANPTTVKQMLEDKLHG